LVCEDAGKAYLCRLGLDAVRERGGTGVTSEAASSDDEDDAKLDAMASDLGRRRRTRSRGSFGALTLILQQVKRQVQKKHPGMRFEGALPKQREVVPRSFVKDAEKRLLCGSVLAGQPEQVSLTSGRHGEGQRRFTDNLAVKNYADSYTRLARKY